MRLRAHNDSTERAGFRFAGRLRASPRGERGIVESL
jgi:hypothetical protein